MTFPPDDVPAELVVVDPTDGVLESKFRVMPSGLRREWTHQELMNIITNKSPIIGVSLPPDGQGIRRVYYIPYDRFIASRVYLKYRD